MNERDDISIFKEMEDIKHFGVPNEIAILPLRDIVIFPAMVSPLIIARPKSIELVDDVMEGDRLIGLVAQKIPELEDPKIDKIYRYGTVANLLKTLKFPDGNVRILVQGLTRFKITRFTKKEPFFKARIKLIEDYFESSVKVKALTRNVSNQFQKIINIVPNLPDELQIAVMNIKDPGKLADLLASNLNLSLVEKQDILESLDVARRLEKLTVLINRELEVLEVGSKIQSKIQSEFGKNQREYYLREQLKAIHHELGEQDERMAEIDKLRQKIELARMPEIAKKEALRELDRLSKMQFAAAEYSVSRTYIDWLISLPWSKSSEDNLDLLVAEKILNNDHYDLKRVKERIIEFLAVRTLKNDSKGPILCFVGPPGVGKTSLGKSIARAMNREFVRISLGGMHDEAEIRGHRRTYIGAIPGRIIQNLKTASTNNPVFMLDEVDKIGQDFRGDPASALLEVLDPEQNYSFTDHYLDVPFDLSHVLFITTANYSDPIPAPLKDRMEMIEIPGYTEEEKIQIAIKHLIPRQRQENGLSTKSISFSKKAIQVIISEFTREAGVRNLERQIGSICRKVAKEVVKGKKDKSNISGKQVYEYLGPPKYITEVSEKKLSPGTATGLAWTPYGGEIMFIETSIMSGKKELILTGQLGDVMKESARAALSIIRSRAKLFNIDEDVFDKHDIHIHVPAGAIPKDGPSAGITMLISLISLLTNNKIESNIAMTGEITLRGKILPVGGIKEKVLAARRAKIKSIILPNQNKRDLELIEDDRLKDDVTFHFVDEIEDVVKLVFP